MRWSKNVVRNFIFASFCISLLSVLALAQKPMLGKVDFPTSAKSKEAQEKFLFGLAALHSFEYEDALEYFQAATKVEPDFALGYWGAAMTYNHPLWSEQDMSSAKQALAKIKDTLKLTERERAYINAAKVLYGEGDKLARDKAYMIEMEKIYRAYPNDLEAAAFYSLAIMGAVRPGDRDATNRNMIAGAIALEVYQKSPNHPGAAHYVIHAFDDPAHAILALNAAQRYAQIAPSAEHALHMPSHIFFSLGMWTEAEKSNEAAWIASNEWVKRKNHSKDMLDNHSLHWLMYVYLQQGRYQKAEEALGLTRQSLNDTGAAYFENYYAMMAAAFVMETERWDLVPEIFRPIKKDRGNISATNPRFSSRVLPIFMEGYIAARRGIANAEKDAADLREMGKPIPNTPDTMNQNRKRFFDVLALEIEALMKANKGDIAGAIELLKQANTNEENVTTAAGPTPFIKPSHELIGEILLRADKPKEAMQAFTMSLQRGPNRARSLLGAARAAAKSGDTQNAMKFYAQFAEQWKNSDAQSAELREAKDYMKQQAKVD
jgi:tetratricopeptide (TPR) repeat protein